MEFGVQTWAHVAVEAVQLPAQIGCSTFLPFWQVQGCPDTHPFCPEVQSAVPVMLKVLVPIAERSSCEAVLPFQTFDGDEKVSPS
jgi:hypothetical protein